MSNRQGFATAPRPGPDAEQARRQGWEDHLALVLEFCGVPSESVTKGWRDFQRLPGKSQALDATRTWATGGGAKPGLLLYGPPGAGKSHLGVAAFRERLTALARQRGLGSNWTMAGLWCNVPHLLRDARRRCFGDGGEAEQSVLDEAAGAAILVLDDVGVRGLSEWASEFLYSVADARWTSRGATIVTSNVAPEGLVGLLGERIMSRLAGLCEPIPVAGGDMRRVSS